ncbi:hypothetical protein BDN71DRAFT_1590438 [Pleurotus eryngii]|uniref:F-box domain-containing protein n=1 Tax=Pleurotus eryngii TaxID=5323 RepID=A0A9P5ZY42_PLEER|nr:hypothetical protein BDN71DRAFT_1590438 [Pleurotus eryngii]
MSLEEPYDAQIRTHREQIQQISERRNADCSATKKLSSEILSLIFQQLPRTGNTPACIHVMRVCRLWRTIAQNEPRLWTDLTYTCTKWLGESIKRSKAAPVSIKYVACGAVLGIVSEPLCPPPYFASTNSSKPPFSHWNATPVIVREILEPLFELPRKLGELHVVGCRDLITRLAAPAPYLSALELAGVDIPENFLGGVAPRLQSVDLRTTRVPLDASWLKNVRRLALCRWRPTGDNNAKTILSTLAQLTQLEFLSMSFPETLTAMGSDIDKVTLSSLKTAQFSFSSDQLRLVGIFDYITCPIIRQLSINWPPDFSDAALAMRVGRFFSENCDFTPDILARVVDPLPQIRVFGRERDGPKLYFANCHLTSLDDFFVQTFPGIHIRCLKILEGGLALRNHPIEELFIRDPEYRALLDEGSIYPNLRRMTLVNISLTPKAQTLSNLKRWLKSQRKLEELTIMGRKAFTEKDIRALREIVAVVKQVPYDQNGEPS